MILSGNMNKLALAGKPMPRPTDFRRRLIEVFPLAQRFRDILIPESAVNRFDVPDDKSGMSCPQSISPYG
jgi:hypothetical protein